MTIAERTTKRDAYEVITSKILELLDAGTVPWKSNWSPIPGMHPMSANTMKAYRGINNMILSLAPYADTRWITYKQAAARGGQVRKGEKAMPVVFWKWFEKTDTLGTTKQIPFLRYYQVFNVEQVDDLDLPQLVAPDNILEPIAVAEAIVAGYPDQPQITHNSPSHPRYIPSYDRIEMPPNESWQNTHGYYEALFHEMGHSTGHSKRLDRKGITGFDHFGSDNYGKEELIAELVSAFLCQEAGIERQTIDNLAAYIKNWQTRIKGDKTIVIQSATAAQRAADLILGTGRE
jgi:antirestriction protein ArdC